MFNLIYHIYDINKIIYDNIDSDGMMMILWQLWYIDMMII